MHITTHSDQETKEYGESLASTLRSGDIICLYGDLGAGKTTLVKGIAEGFGITHDITSPTFTLMNVYQISDLGFQISDSRSLPQSEITNLKSQIKNLVHIDTYRLKNAQELLDIGVEDYLGQPGTVTIVEWPEKVEGLLENKKIIKITIEHGEGDERRLKIERLEDSYKKSP